MINSINGGAMAALQQAPRMDNLQSLSGEQRQTIADTLANYDADNLSAADAAAIVEALGEAGIRAGGALETAMADAGFDARSVGDLARGDQAGRPGPPPPGGGPAGQLNLSDEMISNLNSLLDEYLDGTLEDSEKASLLAEIKEILAEGAPEGGLVNVKA